MWRIETRKQMLSLDKTAALFEGLRPEEYEYAQAGYTIEGAPPKPPTKHHEIRLYATGAGGKEYLVGWTKYITPCSMGDGSFVPYLGYGEGWGDEMIPFLKKWHPQAGTDLMLWLRQHAPAPFYADIMNKRLEQATKAEHNPQTGYSVIKSKRVLADRPEWLRKKGPAGTGPFYHGTDTDLLLLIIAEGEDLYYCRPRIPL